MCRATTETLHLLSGPTLGLRPWLSFLWFTKYRREDHWVNSTYLGISKTKHKSSDFLSWGKKRMIGLNKRDKIQDQRITYMRQWFAVKELLHFATVLLKLPFCYPVCSKGSPAAIKLAGSYSARPSHHNRL